MADATNPQPGVNEVSQDDVSAVAAFLQRTEGGEQPAQPAQAESQPAAPEVALPEGPADTLANDDRVMRAYLGKARGRLGAAFEARS